MKVLHITPSYFPALGWGGPILSTKAICDGIAGLTDVHLRVLTTDAASPDVQDRVGWVPFNYPVHYARRIAGHSVAPGLLGRLPVAIAGADVVHLTGTYNFPTLPTLGLCRLLGKPVVWSPRGALQATADWADAPNKSLKHRFENLAQLLRGQDIVLHVTSQAEAAHSLHRLSGITTALIPNAVAIPVCPAPRVGHGLRLLYLGRLHPKKGLDLLFDAVARLPADVVLDVYGDGDPAYVAGLQQRADVSHGRIHLHGHVEGGAKSEAFGQADIFVLPSYCENFGIAVAEALAHARPVLTTTATPWQGLDQYNAGRCIDVHRDDLATAILQMAGADLPAMGARGRAWMQRDFSPDRMVAAFDQLYRSMVHDPAVVTA